MSIKATFSTAGRATPGLEELSARTTWRHQGRPPGWPYDPDTHDKPSRSETAASERGRRNAATRKLRAPGGASPSVKARAKRLEKFAALLARDITVKDAAAKLGLSERTGREYAAELARRTEP